MRILIVSPYFYPEGGGLERYAFWIAKKLSDGNKVDVLCMTRRRSGVEKFEGLTVYRVKPNLIISNTPLSLRFMLKVARMVKESDMVIAHTPVPFAADVASIIAKLSGVPIEIVYHTVGLEKGAGLLDVIGRIYSATVERVTLRGTKIVAVSHIVWKYLKKHGYNPNISYPPVTLTNTHIKHQFHRKRKVVLFVGQLGRYHRFKNLDMLLHAFAKILQDFPEWELWVVGSGDMMEYYKKLALTLGILKKVKFLGRINDPKKLTEIYSSAGILVLPSAFESFGMVVPEALIHGTPVVVSSNTGARILVSNGKNGLIIDEVSPKTIMKALLSLIENPKIMRKMAIIALSSATSYASF